MDNETKMKEFQELCKPLNDWLRKNYHPHTKIIIETDSAEIVKGAMAVTFGIVDDDIDITIINEAIKRCEENARDKRRGDGSPLTVGTIKCPKCGGKLNYHIANNGHVHGKCETGGCLDWMQ